MTITKRRPCLLEGLPSEPEVMVTSVNVPVTDNTQHTVSRLKTCWSVKHPIRRDENKKVCDRYVLRNNWLQSASLQSKLNPLILKESSIVETWKFCSQCWLNQKSGLVSFNGKYLNDFIAQFCKVRTKTRSPIVCTFQYVWPLQTSGALIRWGMLKDCYTVTTLTGNACFTAMSWELNTLFWTPMAWHQVITFQTSYLD